MSRLLKSLGLAAGGLAALASSGIYYFLRRSLPQTSGTVRALGLKDQVEVIRDRWGVPHIYAQNTDDLFFAQGYVHAQDRLWQMELQRRIGSGRLSEIFGEIALDTDRFVRVLGFRRAAEADRTALRPETSQVLESYARGVNAFVETHRDRLPLEFIILRFRPEPWTAVDTLVWGKVMGWNLSINWDSELLRGRLAAALGEERAAELEPPYPEANPIVLPPEVDYARLGAGVLSRWQKVKDILTGGGQGGGSNNWVVDGAKSVTGKPLLANDPHLPLQMPGVWYLNHLVGDGFNVIGASLPGVPSVIIGHNERIAWGITAGFADVQDLFVERFHPENPHQYEYEGEWEEAQVIREEIVVKGRPEPVVEEVVITRHGPIINAIAPGEEEQPLALRWVGHKPADLVRSFLDLNRAHDWDSFRQALRDYTVPSLNFVYADVDGDIGYLFGGKVPVRAQGQGLVPVPGWTGEYEWTGYIDLDELPQAHNPATHYLATANNRVVDDRYPHFISAEWTNGYRARRICDLLEITEQLSSDDFKTMQMDFYWLPGKELAGYLADLSVEEDDLKQALEIIRNWNYHLTAYSVAGAILQVFLHQMMHNTFADKLGTELAEAYFGKGSEPLLAPVNTYLGRSNVVLLNLMQNPESPWFNRTDTDQIETRDDIMRLSLREAVDYLRGKLGPDMNQWQWGKLHQVTFVHPLGAVKPLNLLFNKGPFPLGGDTDTVFQAAIFPYEPYDVKSFSVSYRQIIDLADLSRSVAIAPPGQSGQPGSKHYGDTIDDWLNGGYHPLLWHRADIEREQEATLTLTP